ncbi:L-glutamine ABC transporter membrane protein /L-glutamate ABC transporter membrane protein /L-aspartate ABC transporter membrane protein /L-asparagine ABC transporter membrane protein [Rhodobacter viridis]|uniref:L-glutamine ABC transporter membrane protein /L-glutamate ABC transporter membrane protein /L-aspartate ABC transporter membrane protein /L-asparagine ABC transporter membrane protein n=1 Tax=Rhodobacter viridis TaxID=1054202 RepID=A0A318TZY2_9RHOB|nr:amino acid ABC transporter permease [Rhodobacter viridis]PYF11001.1 L-glutamine ABC transporter membrane protein /L-glutamate ABC transporter membrane protein /L-aspartate ABC transporter membrane protein /L-asparagine ABC transporter membrane protein [Rhodobacter viridis]
MSDTSFVRTEMLPPKPAPVSQVGVVKWMRENLFSGPLNTALTVFGLLVTAWLVQAGAPWLIHGVWNANSLTECRTIIAERWGPEATGACWAIIRVRWNQFLFGFYPVEEYWRLFLTFAGLFLALAPVLFDALPRKLIWGTLLYPLVAFWLLWGGPVWGPVGVLVGFALMGLAFTRLAPKLGVPVAAGAGLILAAVVWLYAVGPFESAMQSVLPLALPEVVSDKFGGFLLALVIGVTAIVVSLPLGILLALGRQSDMVMVKALSVGMIEFIRGVPLITLLFTASLLLQYFLPPGTTFDLILRVVILVTLFAAAYIAEVIRGGLAALPRGQYEAADALGLDYWQAQRLIIMPQALKISIPGIVSSFIGLFKDTTLVTFVGLFDPLKGISGVVRSDMAWKGTYWEPYIFVAVIFFLFNFSMSRYSMYLERKLKRDHR